MIPDYNAFLHVADDGHIWWPLQEAFRLGAGFVPVREDNNGATVKLQAFDDDTRTNEQTLIDAFGDTSLSIELPKTVEREGIHFVDAADFLAWLSQYITQSQVKNACPSELTVAVREAKAKAAAQQQSVAKVKFESLTLALEDWFDKKLEELPEALRQRVERDFPPIPWERLSSDQRRKCSIQWDYQHDPSTEQERQFWFDFFDRENNLKAKLEEWQATAALTASDLALKETRIKELQQEIDRMDLQKRQERGDYYPDRKQLAANREAIPAGDFIAYPKAIKILSDKWNAVPEELAAWIFLGPEAGGIEAFRNANEMNPPLDFSFAYFHGCEDYLSPLMTCWFRQDDIDRFEPADRYITGEALIERWCNLPGGRPEAFIRAKIAESRLLDMHPTFGGTEATFGKDNVQFPPLSAGLFAMSHIMQIETEDGLDLSEIPFLFDTNPVQDVSVNEEARVSPIQAEADENRRQRYKSSTIKREARKLETLEMYKAWRKEYRKLKNKHQNVSDAWCASRISKMDVAKGRNADTIRKNMKK